MFQSLGLGRASPQQVFELGDREPPADVDLKGRVRTVFESVDLTLPKVH